MNQAFEICSTPQKGRRGQTPAKEQFTRERERERDTTSGSFSVTEDKVSTASGEKQPLLLIRRILLVQVE